MKNKIKEDEKLRKLKITRCTGEGQGECARYNMTNVPYRKDDKNSCPHNRFVDCDCKADCTTCGWNPSCYKCRVEALRLLARCGLLVRR